MMFLVQKTLVEDNIPTYNISQTLARKMVVLTVALVCARIPLLIPLLSRSQDWDGSFCLQT